MKNKIILFASMVVLGLVVGISTKYSKAEASTPKKIYPLATVVFSVDKVNDTVICEDCNGNLFSFYGVEDWKVGDGCALLMNTNGTKKIKDDFIISARYFNLKNLRK